MHEYLDSWCQPLYTQNLQWIVVRLIALKPEDVRVSLVELIPCSTGYPASSVWNDFLSATMTSSSSSTNDVMPQPSLTLIVAATRNMGIGFRGTLPWPMLKQEMAYFARVTQRPPPLDRMLDTATKDTKYINAVIMGRKTWESIPEKFRPLKGRVNVVVSRTPEALDFADMGKEKEEDGIEAMAGKGKKLEEKPIAVKTIQDGLVALQLQHMSTPGSDSPPPQLGRVFVIGGAEIYTAALQMPECETILMTNILTEFECDTFFPVDLMSQGETDSGDRWIEQSKSVLDHWVGEDVPDGVRTEREVEYEFKMWRRIAGS